ncbi:MAG: hypothetical protein ACLP5V_06065 [Candidatus Bathyarchaeia archaeon]
MRRKSLFGLLVILALGLLLVNVKPTWALTVNPPPPTAGVPFTITSGELTQDFLTVYAGFSCSGSVVFGPFLIAALGSVTVPGLPAGQYSASIPGDHHPKRGCLAFIIMPAATSTTTTTLPIPEYPYGLPLLAILLVIGYGVVRRRINY